MKRFVVRVALEFVAIATAAIVAAQLVKSGHPAVGLGILAIYGMIGLYRLGVEKINAQYERNIKEARIRRLEADLSVKEAQTRRLEAVLVDAATKASWVSDVKIRDNKAVYKIDAPGRGRIVIYLPATEEDAKTNDAPVASNKG
jgi:hypothetical protein